MLDTNVWSAYKGTKAEYAIGGPTLEMLLKSYNQKHGVDFRARVSNNEGYEISKDGGVNWSPYYNSMMDASDSLYTINSNIKSNAMILASPFVGSTNGNVDGMSIVWYLGGITGSRITTGNGLRPIVCLLSDVGLEKEEDGSYVVK